jgi:TonB family protein
MPLIVIVFLAISAYQEIPVDESAATDSNSVAPPPPPPPVPSGSENISEELWGAAEPYVKVDEMPQFPGGDKALMQYIGENTRYPDFSKSNHIQGKVIVRFCISEKGEVTRVSVLQGVSADLDNEAIRVVKALPAFKPGREDGKDVPVWFMVPISFTLR